MTTFIAPSAKQIQQLVQEQPQETFHVFSGTRHLATLIHGLAAVKRYGACFAILSEPRVGEGWQGWLRYFQSWLTEGWLRAHCTLVLAIGRNGPPWFLSVGYDANQVFPFAYFVEPPRFSLPVPSETDDKASQPLHIGYVGRFVAMKGVFDLVQAVALLEQPLRLILVGAGPEEARLRTACVRHGIAADFRGVLPMPSIGAVMARLDVLVLASTSKDDGWGVVVSEALMSGTAAIATPCVGASLVLDDPRLGVVVPPHDPAAIAKAIRTLQDVGAFAPPNRLARQVLARSRLSAAAGARYFVAVLCYRLEGGACPMPFFQYSPDAAGMPPEPGQPPDFNPCAMP
jgi:glycosyltransferase involved in cell wall biosynthesis